MNKKNEPSLEDLGLDQPVASQSVPGKISIRSLQLESEADLRSGQSVSQVSIQMQQPSENVLGIVGFVLSLIGFFTLGCVSPIATIVCFFGLAKKPVGLAVAGLILSTIGSLGFALFGMWFLLSLIVG